MTKEIAERVKERVREISECPHSSTHVENDRRFGRITVCDACDLVLDVKKEDQQ